MTASIDIDPHGRVLPGEDARRALADRAGRFTLLPSAPDLLLLARTPAAGGAAPSPRCVLAGDLSAFPIADFLSFVHQARLSGTLTVAAGGLEREITFRRGEVRSARSGADSERIGEIAHRLGHVTREALDALSPGDRRFGRALVDAGHLTAGDLWKCLHEQVTVVFHAMLVAREGIFHLLDDADQEPVGAPLSIDTQSLLMDGIRRIDELSLFTSRIPGPQAFVKRREPPRPVTLQPEEARVLALVDGRRRVSELAAEARLSDFEAMKILYRLAEAGYVEASTAPAAPLPRAAPDGAALVAGVNGALGAIAVAAREVGCEEELVAGLRGFLADPTSRYAPLLRRVPLGSDAALDPAVLLGNAAALNGAALRAIEPSGDAARYLRNALRELLFFALFQVGERLDRSRDEALATEVKERLAEMGDLT